MRLRRAALVVLVVVAGACAGAEYPRVSLSEDGALTPPDPDRSGAPRKLPLRVGVAAVISPQATFDAYKGLLDYLGAELNRPVQLLQRGTYAETNELIRSGDAALGFVGSGAYVEGHREFGMEILAVPQVRHQTHYYSYIVVPHDSTATSLADLRGRRFAYSDPLSNSGRLAPVWRLLELGEFPEGFFSSTDFTYSHDNSIRAVANRLVDGAAVDSHVYDAMIARDPAYRERTRVIDALGPYANPPIVVHPDLDPALKDRLRTLFLEMAGTPGGKAALAPLMIDRYVILGDVDYDLTRVMAALIRGWYVRG